MIKTPTNPYELLQNIKYAVRQRLILDEGFYTEENIRQLTSGKEIRLDQNKNGKLFDVGVLDLLEVFPNQPDLKLYEISLEFSLKRNAKDGEKQAVAEGSILVKEPDWYYTKIEQLIEYPWQILLPDPIRVLSLRVEPTDPYGNVEREYTHTDGKIEETGYFDFNSVGCLSSFMFRLGEQ